MEKKWLSNFKGIPFGIVITLIFFCSCKDSESKIATGDFLKIKREFRIKQPTPIDGSISTVIDDQNTFYSSILFAREIYQISAPYDTFEVIGERGEGPGQYLTPYYLYLFDNNLYFSDINTPFIKTISLNSKKTIKKKPLTINVGVGGRQFCVDKEYIYVKNFMNPLISLYSKQKEQLLDSKIVIDDTFVKTNKTINGGGIAIDSKGNIYIAPALPLEIYVCKNINGHIQIMDTLDLSLIANFESLSVSKFDELRKASKNTQNPLNNLLSNIAFIVKLKIFETKDGTFLIAAVRDKGKVVQIFLSEKGELIGKLPPDSPVIIDGNRNGLFFYKTLSDEGYSLIKHYVFEHVSE